jgi:hypothetical protein
MSSGQAAFEICTVIATVDAGCRGITSAEGETGGNKGDRGRCDGLKGK